MAVPAAVAEADHPHPCLDQAAGHQQVVVAGRRPIVLILVGLSVAIGGTDFRVFLFEIKRVEQPAAGEHIKGSLPEAVHAVEDACRIHIPAKRVDFSKQLAAILQPVERHRPQRHIF
jgi:hypothetical protein